MNTVRRAVATACVFALMCASVYADVIPASYAEESGDRAKVEAKLTEMGLKAETARARAASMTGDVAAYFAEDVQRIQVSGQELFAGQTDMMWYEWIGGIIGLGGAAALIYYMADET